MKRKLPIDAQMLSCAKEDLVIKKRLVEQMDKFDKEYSDSMQRLTSNMEKTGNSIAEGFSVLKQLICPQHVQPPFPYPPLMYNTHSSTFEMSNMPLNQSYDSPSPSPSPYSSVSGSSL